MPFEFELRLGPFAEASDRGVHAGLIAAAETYVGAVKRELEHGYTSGDFVTGNNVNAVARGEPEVVDGAGRILVGSTQTDPPYPMYWELGHINLFTRRYERKEVWAPTLTRMRDQLVAVCAEEIRAVMP